VHGYAGGLNSETLEHRDTQEQIVVETHEAFVIERLKDVFRIN